MILITHTCSHHHLLFLLLSTAYISGGGAVANSAASPSPSMTPADMNLSIFMKANVVVYAVICVVIFSVCLNIMTAIVFVRENNFSGAVASAGRDGGSIHRFFYSEGINREILGTFPILVYSTIKNHMIGKEKLECAVCLREFEDDETLRLIPKCDHVFHTECIDVWLASNVTCPLCRADLRLDSGEVIIGVGRTQLNAGDGLNDEEGGVMNQTQHLLVEGASSSSNITGRDRRNNMVEERKDKQSRSKRWAWKMLEKIPRSNSTGHSLPTTAPIDTESCTLRLPEDVRRHLLMNHAAIRRSVSFHGVAPLKGVDWSDSDDGEAAGGRER